MGRRLTSWERSQRERERERRAAARRAKTAARRAKEKKAREAEKLRQKKAKEAPLKPSADLQREFQKQQEILRKLRQK